VRFSISSILMIFMSKVGDFRDAFTAREYGSNLIAFTAQTVAKTTLPVSNPSVKNFKFLIQPTSPLPIETS
jgi:hypothetical protein